MYPGAVPSAWALSPVLTCHKEVHLQCTMITNVELPQAPFRDRCSCLTLRYDGRAGAPSLSPRLWKWALRAWQPCCSGARVGGTPGRQRPHPALRPTRSCSPADAVYRIQVYFAFWVHVRKRLRMKRCFSSRTWIPQLLHSCLECRRSDGRLGWRILVCILYGNVRTHGSLHMHCLCGCS